MKPCSGPLKLDSHATYRIRISGHLNRAWSGQFGGMSICTEATTNNATRSVLTGQLVDQAALFGVLNKLYGLGFPLVSVECVEAEPSHQG